MKKLVGNVILNGIGKDFLINTERSIKNHIDYILSNFYYTDIYNDFENTTLQNKILNQYISYFRCNKIMCDNFDLEQLKKELKINNIELTTQQIINIIIKSQYKIFFQNNYKTNQKKEALTYQQLLNHNCTEIKKIYIHPIFYKKHKQLFSKSIIPYRQFFLTYKNIPCIFDKTIQDKQKVYVVV